MSCNLNFNFMFFLQHSIALLRITITESRKKPTSLPRLITALLYRGVRSVHNVGFSPVSVIIKNGNEIEIEIERTSLCTYHPHNYALVQAVCPFCSNF